MDKMSTVNGAPVLAPADGEDEAVRQMAALSHATRLAVFRRLMRAGPAGVAAGVLSEELGVSPSNLSAHLNVLTGADLAVMRKDGRRRLYAPRVDTVRGLVDFLVEECCADHPEVGPFRRC